MAGNPSRTTNKQRSVYHALSYFLNMYDVPNNIFRIDIRILEILLLEYNILCLLVYACSLGMVGNHRLYS